MTTNEEINRRLEKLMEELHEFGVDAAYLTATWMQDGKTRHKDLEFGNCFSIEGMLRLALQEKEVMELHPLSTSDEDDEGDDWKSTT